MPACQKLMPADVATVFAAGLLTFLSPCILPLVPVYLGLLGGAALTPEAGPRPLRLISSALAFSAGLALVFVGMGMAATVAGRALIAHRTLLLQLGGLAVFLFGLKFLGVLQLPWLENDYRPLLAKAGGGGVLRGLLLGAAFGLGWSPCVGPILGSVLTYAASAAATPWRGGILLAAYAAGLAVPLVAIAAVAPLALPWLKRLQKHMRAMQLTTGALLAAVGLLLITDTLGLLQPSVGAPSLPPSAPVVAAEESCSSSAQPGSCGLPIAVADNAPGPALELSQGAELLEFVSSRCPVCLRMAPVVAAAESDCAGKSVRVRKIRVDTAEGLALARRSGVIGVPTFLFMDAAGKEIARLVGEQPLAVMRQALQVLSGEQCSSFRAFPSTDQASH